MSVRPDEELDYYATLFKKIRNKKYEFFVISRIIHLLNDSEIEFSTQQLVRTEDGRFLLDLYFPQFKLAIEIDEAYHNKDHQIDKDKARDKAIVESVQICIERIAVTGKSFSEVNTRIDEIVCLIRQNKKEAPKFLPFVYGEKYKTEYWLKIGKLSIFDDARFRTHVDVAKLFGKNYAGHQQAVIELGANQSVWFPKLYKNGDWDNNLSADGLRIEMKKMSDGRYSAKRELKPNARIYVFAHHRDDFGQIYYAFKGVFDNRWVNNISVHSRLFDTFAFDGKGFAEPLQSDDEP